MHVFEFPWVQGFEFWDDFIELITSAVRIDSIVFYACHSGGIMWELQALCQTMHAGAA
jgi:hypothetical protein